MMKTLTTTEYADVLGLGTRQVRSNAARGLYPNAERIFSRGQMVWIFHFEDGDEFVPVDAPSVEHRSHKELSEDDKNVIIELVNAVPEDGIPTKELLARFKDRPSMGSAIAVARLIAELVEFGILVRRRTNQGGVVLLG